MGLFGKRDTRTMRITVSDDLEWAIPLDRWIKESAMWQLVWEVGKDLDHILADDVTYIDNDGLRRQAQLFVAHEGVILRAKLPKVGWQQNGWSAQYLAHLDQPDHKGRFTVAFYSAVERADGVAGAAFRVKVSPRPYGAETVCAVIHEIHRKATEGAT